MIEQTKDFILFAPEVEAIQPIETDVNRHEVAVTASSNELVPFPIFLVPRFQLAGLLQ